MSVLGFLVVVAVIAAATTWGVLRRRQTGRMRAPARDAGPGAEQKLGADQIGAALGDRATFVQFSSAFCRPCVATRRVLADVAGELPGVRHVDIDAESQLELVRGLGVTSTPTTLLLDADGVVRRRATGVPRREVLYTAVADVLAQAER